jgi:CRP-like cAMP-binding protein
VRQPDGGHGLRIRVHHLTFGRSTLRAYLAAYRLFAYQLLCLLLDALRQARLQSSRLARLRIAPSLMPCSAAICLRLLMPAL